MTVNLTDKACSQFADEFDFVGKVLGCGVTSLTETEQHRWMMRSLCSFKNTILDRVYSNYEYQIAKRCQFFKLPYPLYPHGDPYASTEEDLEELEENLKPSIKSTLIPVRKLYQAEMRQSLKELFNKTDFKSWEEEK